MPSDDACTAVAERPNVTPYCLDHNNRRMIFAETPPEINLSDAPFYYQAQYEAATRLIAIPYDQVHEIAARKAWLPRRSRFHFFRGTLRLDAVEQDVEPPG